MSIKPIPTHPVPAVAAVIIRDRAILLVQRGNPPGLGLWSIPGGSVELGETIEEALIREVWEETGLKIKVGDFAGVTDLIIREGETVRFHYVILDYFAEVVSGDMRPATDAKDCRFVPLDELSNYEITESLLTRLKELDLL